MERRLLCFEPEVPVLKLTRLNNQVVAINPDHISWVDASPDTVLFLFSGDKILVRESLDELIELVIQFRRAIRGGDLLEVTFPNEEGDRPRVPSPRMGSRPPGVRNSSIPTHRPQRGTTDASKEDE